MHRNLSFALFIAGLTVASFLAGATLTAFELFPHAAIANVRRGAKAAMQAVRRKRAGRWTMVWHPARGTQRGLIRHDAARACNGYTLYSSANQQAALLIGMDGSIVHTWRRPYREIWDRSFEAPHLPDSNYVYWRKTAMMPNGDCLAVIEESGATPWGLGLIKFDKESHIIWKYGRRAHHDFDICPDGKIFVLTHAICTKLSRHVPNLKAPFLEDFVVVLSPEGKELKRISLYRALASSPYRRIIDMAAQSEKGDYLHANSVKILREDRASAFPFAQPGQLLISMRDVDFIGILDTSSEKFTWGMRGHFFAQHDPDFLQNGNILLFDNLGRVGVPGGRSRVIEINPRTGALLWSFHGSAENPFFSEVRSSQQRLPNGNTLITESDPGRLLEVTPQGEIVWEYINPESGGELGEMVAAACCATRYLPEELDSSFKSFLQSRQPSGG